MRATACKNICQILQFQFMGQKAQDLYLKLSQQLFHSKSNKNRVMYVECLKHIFLTQDIFTI